MLVTPSHTPPNVVHSLPDPLAEGLREINALADVLITAQSSESENAPLMSEVVPNASKKGKKQKNPPLLRVGPLKIVPYWKDKGDDEEENEESGPLGVAQHAAYFGGLAVIAGESAYFNRDYPVGSMLAGPAIDLSKTYYANGSMNHQRAMAAGAMLSLIAAFALHLSLTSEQKGTQLYQLFASLPLAYPAMGVLKQKLNDFQETLSSIAESKLSLPEKKAKIIGSVVQMVLAGGLSLADLSPSLTASAAMFFKSNMRQLLNILGKAAFTGGEAGERTCRATVILGSDAALLALGVLGNATGLFSGKVGQIANLVTLLPAADVLSRTLKMSIKSWQKDHKKKGSEDPAENCGQRMKGVAKDVLGVFLCILPLLAVAALLAQANNSSAGPLIAAFVVDAISMIKPLTKQFEVGTLTSMSIVGGIMPGTVAFAAKHALDREIPQELYLTLLVFAGLTSTFLIYHAKRATRAPNLQTSPTEV